MSSALTVRTLRRGPQRQVFVCRPPALMAPALVLVLGMCGVRLCQVMSRVLRLVWLQSRVLVLVLVLEEEGAP